MNPIFELHCFIDSIFKMFGGDWWITYFLLKKIAIACLTFHMLLFRLELKKPFPRIPYKQEDLYDLLFGE